MTSKGQTNTKRKDKNRIVLRTGESQRANGTYDFRWTDRNGKRHTIYAKTLDDLRERENQIARDLQDGIKIEESSMTLDDMYERWFVTKSMLKDNTKQNYQTAYKNWIKPFLGNYKLNQIRKADVVLVYSNLLKSNLRVGTLKVANQILFQILELAVDESLIRSNPAKGCQKDLLRKAGIPEIDKKTGLTLDEQRVWLSFIKNDPRYQRFYPIIAVMIGTGMRVSEVIPLVWDNVDFENGYIYINHALKYSRRFINNKPTERKEYFIDTPKTSSSVRKVKMLDFVRDALLDEKEKQRIANLKSSIQMNGYSNFVFFNRNGTLYKQSNINDMIKDSIKDYNDRTDILIAETGIELIKLPYITCHSLRHTFTNRMCEAGVNIKTMQGMLGHTSAVTTLNIYTDLTQRLELEGFEKLQNFISS